MELRESTTVTVKMGPFVDKTDAVTPKTGLTLVVKVAKNGGAKATRNSATAATHDADGDYFVELNATDTNTLGRLRATVADATQHLPVWHDYMVIAAAYYDEKYGTEVTLTAAGANTGTLDAGASAVDGYYVGQLLTLTRGTGVGQTRRIIGYVGSTKVATVDSNWTTNPVAGTAFRLIASASGTLTSTERDAVVDAYLDRTDAIAAGVTPRKALKIMAALLGGKSTGPLPGVAGTYRARNPVADNKDVVTATVDINGYRSAVSYDFS